MYVTYANWRRPELPDWQVFVSRINWPVINPDFARQCNMSDWLIPGTQDEELCQETERDND